MDLQPSTALGYLQDVQHQISTVITPDISSLGSNFNDLVSLTLLHPYQHADFTKPSCQNWLQTSLLIRHRMHMEALDWMCIVSSKRAVKVWTRS